MEWDLSRKEKLHTSEKEDINSLKKAKDPLLFPFG